MAMGLVASISIASHRSSERISTKRIKRISREIMYSPQQGDCSLAAYLPSA